MGIYACLICVVTTDVLSSPLRSSMWFSSWSRRLRNSDNHNTIVIASKTLRSLSAATSASPRGGTGNGSYGEQHLFWSNPAPFLADIWGVAIFWGIPAPFPWSTAIWVLITLQWMRTRSFGFFLGHPSPSSVAAKDGDVAFRLFLGHPSPLSEDSGESSWSSKDELAWLEMTVIGSVQWDSCLIRQLFSIVRYLFFVPGMNCPCVIDYLAKWLYFDFDS